MPFSPKLVRIVRRLLISLAVFATLIALVVLVENWRGDRAWKRYAAEHAARGEILDELPNPSTLRPEVNFFKTPVLDPWVSDEKIEDFLKKISAPNIHSAGDISKGWTTGREPDFKGIVEALRKDQEKLPVREGAQSAAVTPSAQLLELLAPMDSILIELRQAAQQRPDAQLARLTPVPRNWGKYRYPNFEFALVIGTTLSLHASASLAEQHREIACDDTLAGLKLSRGFCSAPDAVLIETLVGAALLKHSLQPIWQGLQHHAWSEDQLEKIQQEITQTDLFKSLDRALAVERAITINTLEEVPLGDLFPRKPYTWMLRLVPRAWMQQNKITYCDWSAAAFQVRAARGTPGFLAKLSNADKLPKGVGRFLSPYTIVARMSSSSTRQITQTVTSVQAFLTLAQTACALERYWLVHDNYPGSLAELVPAYLDKVPTDIINGQPLRYGRTGNGKFSLYSIGLDGKDDGGKPIDIKQSFDSEGDWAWPQPVEG